MRWPGTKLTTRHVVNICLKSSVVLWSFSVIYYKLQYWNVLGRNFVLKGVLGSNIFCFSLAYSFDIQWYTWR